ncbi:unnamed protein product, partial [Darwinula stevensoni]
MLQAGGTSCAEKGESFQAWPGDLAWPGGTGSLPVPPGGYLMTAPKRLRSNSTQQICLHLLNVEGAGKARVSLTKETGNASLASTVVHPFANGSGGCFPFRIPSIQGQMGKLQLRLTLDGAPGIAGRESEPVEVGERRSLVFVQTDKPLYLPGQTVRFWILVLDAALKPLDDQVRQVWVKGPSLQREAHWKELPSTAGIVQLQHRLHEEAPVEVSAAAWRVLHRLDLHDVCVRLSQDRVCAVAMVVPDPKIPQEHYDGASFKASGDGEGVLEDRECERIKPGSFRLPIGITGMIVLNSVDPGKQLWGSWKVKVDVRGSHWNEVKHFQVADFVLPKYSVEIGAPEVLLGDAAALDVSVCARYPHVGPVEGELILRVEPFIPIMETFRVRYPGLTKEFKIDVDRYSFIFQHHMKGCHKESIPTEALGMDNEELAPQSITITAAVKEKGTGVEITDSVILRVERNPLEIDVDSSPIHFRPGFVYDGLVKLKFRAGSPAQGQKILICENPDEREGAEKCRNYTSDSRGLVRFQIPPKLGNIGSFLLEVSAPEMTKDYPKRKEGRRYGWNRQIYAGRRRVTVGEWHSPSSSYIQILRPSGKGEMEGCRGSVRFRVSHSDSPAGVPSRFHYQIISRGNILASADFDRKADGKMEDFIDPELLLYESEEISDPQRLSVTAVEIPVIPEMAPESKLVVFYVRADGEVVSDYFTFQVDRCLPNKVELNWSQEEVRPGSKVGLKLKAEPNSVCGLKVVHKSVNLLHPEHQINLESVFQAVKSLQIHEAEFPAQSTDSDFCLRHRHQKNSSQENYHPQDGFESEYSHSHALTSFDRSGLVVLSNLSVFTIPCSIFSNWGDGEIEGRQPAEEETDPQVDDAAPPSALVPEIKESPHEDYDYYYYYYDDSRATKVRDYFPETWLWSLETVGETGELEKILEVPDNIAEWVGSAVCISPLKGMGLSSPQPLIVSQSFFLGFTLPYS